MTLTVPFDLNDYSLEQELFQAELGLVYQGRRKTDDAIVAVKVIAPQFTFDDFFVRRFKDMTRQMTRLEHPNIVRTYEAGQDGDKLYVVQELIETRSLADLLAEEEVLSPQRMLTIARQISAALDYAHQKSITHGDLSASRVYVGLHDHTVVADFGQMQAMLGTSLVKKGYAVGSPETTAPERVKGQGPTRQSDLYSLGVLCYQMLAGQPPFTGDPTAILHAQAYEQPPPLHVINPGISVPLSETIRRMLSKGLELRYNTGSEFARALTVASEGTAPVRSPAVAAAQRKAAGLPSTAPWWKRSWLWAVIAIPLLIIVLAFGFGAVSLSTYLAASVWPPTPTSSQIAAVPPTSAPTESVAPTAQSTVAPKPTTPPTTAPPSPTPSPLPPATSTPTLVPTVTPTLVPFPTPGPSVSLEDSPFTNLLLAHNISNDNKPEKTSLAFAPGPQPIYLFFDYDKTIKVGDTWTHRWTWGDTELGTFEEVWPDNFYEEGTAWVFHSPTGGFQPGPYKVALEINGQVVATATFVVEAGGL